MATTWEYDIRYWGRGKLPAVLKAAGDDGWELVSKDDEHRQLVFKRPRGGG
jgi:hypothetical protein